MKWVLKAREQEMGFLGRDDTGQLTISAASGTALEFESQQDAERFRDNLAPTETVAAWSNRQPQLLPVRLGAKSFIVPGAVAPPLAGIRTASAPCPPGV